MLTIEIYSSGAAFDEPRGELARILRNLADRIENHNTPETLHDMNGNRCGRVYFSHGCDLNRLGADE